MKFGVQYYPSHWPESRWPEDVRLMKQAGVRYVRMGDLSWSAFERSAGKLEFDWMDRAIALLGEAGIRTILCTSSRTPPPWLYRAKPGMAPVDQKGLIRHTDGRYAVAMAHPEFVEEAERFDGALIRHFARNENIVAWQIDNEIGCHTDCYCDRCLGEFHLYLERKYKTPEALNVAWGEHFWAFTVDRFEDVPRPVEHPHIRLEYRRFLSTLNKAFAAWRTALIRELDPGKPITTNFQNIYIDHSDYHDMAETIDVNGTNHYPARTPELTLDYYRGGRGELWVLEQQTHLQTLDVPAGWMRLWAWMAIAHGASALIYFRWRQSRWGSEQFADGILPHSARPGRFYDELCKIGGELDKLAPLIGQTRPRSEVAIVFSYESRWAVQAANYPEQMNPVVEAVEIHKAVARNVSSVDALDPRSDLSSYRLVIAPRLWLVDEAIARNLRSYVEQGGMLCLTAGSGVVDEFGKCFEEPRPGRLSDLAGIRVSDIAHAPDLKLGVASATVEAFDGLSGGVFADEIHLEGAEVVATHAAGWRKGLPAVTSHCAGSGRVVYIGLGLDADSWNPVAAWLLREAGIERTFERPDRVSVYERSGGNGRLLFLLNWNDQAKELTPGPGWTDVFSGDPVDATVQIAANDLRILWKIF